MYTVSNPHASTPQSTDGLTTYAYDELGRATSISAPDGHSTTYSYTGNIVTITDPLQHPRQQAYDAFGNLSSVLEPDGSGALNWQTVYTRNDLGLLTQIDQKGGSGDPSQWRSRYFSYDGFQRLLTQTTKEAGQYTYSYDSNGKYNAVRQPELFGQYCGLHLRCSE